MSDDQPWVPKYWQDAPCQSTPTTKDHHCEFCEGAEWGAGWAFAIIGMAQAIADGVRDGRFSEECWEYAGGDTWEQWRDGELVATRIGSGESWHCAWCHAEHLGRCPYEP